tara:strand:- start:18000 stop:20432 length:2433 start_codon:yes stop_codon:yes gene_type:complete
MQHPTLFLSFTAAILAGTSLAQGPQDFGSSLDGSQADGLVQASRSIAPVRELLTAPLVDVDEDGAVWARTRDMRARFDATGTTIYPVFGPESPQEWPVRFDVSQVTRGCAILDTEVVELPSVQAGIVTTKRADFQEVHYLGLDAIEQTFVFQQFKGEGDLILELDVETELEAQAHGEHLSFGHGHFGSVEYGTAVVLDASGRQMEIQRTWTGERIVLTVPDAFLTSAVFPVTVDPLLTTNVLAISAADDARPDVAYCGLTGEYMVCWEEYTSALNSDAYVTKWNSDMTVQESLLPIDLTNQNWRGPRVAYSRGHDRALVVGSVDSSLSILSSVVKGRFVDAGAFATIGSAFNISSTGAPKPMVDVGGCDRAVPGSESQFCVTWSHLVTPDNSNISYRIIDWTGSFDTAIVNLPDATNHDITPSISEGLGDTLQFGDFWTLTWIRDNDQDGLGQVMARTVYFDGNFGAGTGNIVVDSGTNNANPTTTSLMNDDISFTGARPFVIAYETRVMDLTHPTGERFSIYMRVISGDEIGPESNLGRMENFDRSLHQRRPVLAGNGRGFLVAYLEEDYDDLGAEQWQVYMASGEITEASTDARIALSERHVALATTDDPEIDLAIGSVWSGEDDSGSRFAAVVWSRQNGASTTGFGQINGAVVYHSHIPQSTARAVGRQFCDATPNSVGDDGGRTRSWMRMTGTQSTTENHLISCLDLPANEYGFLLVSGSNAVSYPSSSEGILCVSGSVGRYTDQLQSSGAAGTMQFSVDPTALVRPWGIQSAMPGETWYFQAWHRDNVNGMSTSNFTNAVAVTFH